MNIDDKEEEAKEKPKENIKVEKDKNNEPQKLLNSKRFRSKVIIII